MQRQAFLEPVDFSCFCATRYASLRPASEALFARKYLKRGNLKDHFKYLKSFPQPVEKPVENFPGSVQNPGVATTSTRSLNLLRECGRVKMCLVSKQVRRQVRWQIHEHCG